MPDILLHHYENSPFAELARLALGLKGLSWRSVIIPNMMPKPDLVELTGGYGRTPVLQVDADIYCDTQAILTALEGLQPEPTLYPAPLGALHRMIAGWAGASQFAAHVGAAMRDLPPGLITPEFAEDRRRRFVGFDFDTMSKHGPAFEAQVEANTVWIGQVLADGRSFIGGEAPGHGDLALYVNLWFLRQIPFAKAFADRVLSPSNLEAWFHRVCEIGHGERTEATADDAIAIANSAAPLEVSGGDGSSVAVMTVSSTDDPVRGKLLWSDCETIVVRREGARTGALNIHFPRIGQNVLAE